MLRLGAKLAAFPEAQPFQPPAPLTIIKTRFTTSQPEKCRKMSRFSDCECFRGARFHDNVVKRPSRRSIQAEHAVKTRERQQGPRAPT
jgi:hypothetical protein